MVNRCVCFDVRFETLKTYADRHGLNERGGLDRLQREFSCGRGCGMCIPYIRVMLRTGRTSFDPCLPPNADTGDDAASGTLPMMEAP